MNGQLKLIEAQARTIEQRLRLQESLQTCPERDREKLEGQLALYDYLIGLLSRLIEGRYEFR